MNALRAATLLLALFSALTQARPVSYVGGWTVLGGSNRQNSSVLTHYTTTPKQSWGIRVERDRLNELTLSAIQPTLLVKRWFGKDYQANVYATAGLGQARQTGTGKSNNDLAGFVGVMADWETRRHFLSYQNRYLDAGTLGGGFTQAARVGWAPYEGDTGDLHTWVMLEVDHRPVHEQPVGVTPLVRFFKGATMVELGYTLNNHQPLINFAYRF